MGSLGADGSATLGGELMITLTSVACDGSSEFPCVVCDDGSLTHGLRVGTTTSVDCASDVWFD